MKLDSFRYKISLLSLLLSGGVLLVFGLFFMSVISRVGFQRIDRELRILVDEQASKRQYPPGHWKRFDESMQAIYGGAGSKPFAIRVISVRGQEIYTSKNWLAALTDSRLPVPSAPIPGKADELSERPLPPPHSRPLNENPDAGSGGRFDPHPLPLPPPPPKIKIRGPVFATFEADKTSWRIIGIGNEELNLYLGMDLSAFFAEIIRFRNAFLVALPVALFLLAFGGWLIAQRALRPVKVIAETAGSMTTRGLNLRIPKGDADREFAGLIDVINGMLDRLEKSFEQAVRFSGDAAHELKTPLTILQGQLEQALQEAPAGSEEQQKYSGLLEEVRRLAVITKKLLLLSQADSGRMRLNLEPLDLSSAIDSLFEDMAILAPGLRLDKAIDAGVRVMADAGLMNQVLQNLFTNAIKYNCKDGWIRVVLHREGEVAKFSISNSGEEIPMEEKERIFERFYRISKSHNREIDGAGLGLSLAREIVLAHKGELFLDYSSNGMTTFTMRLCCLKPTDF